MRHNKLVRDRIPEIIKKKGDDAATHLANDEEYGQKLKDKLNEEVMEFIHNGDEQELADVLEVIYAICEHKGIKKKDLENIRKKKRQERGGFARKIILDEVI